MKLFIQIPCYNEEKQLEKTLLDLPKKIKGISIIKFLIIDDGSIDNTFSIAKKNNVDYIVSHKINRGLAKAFETGLKSCIALGADIIVNTDADNQYNASYIEDLIKPILNNECHICIGSRPIKNIDDFSFFKKKLQKIGSFVVRKLSGIDIEDATSGFRSFSRYAALNLHVISKFTYTLDTIFQAGQRNIQIKNIPIEVNSKTRESRLFKSNLEYVLKSFLDIIYITAQVNPLKIFGSISLISFLFGFFIGLRFIILMINSDFNFSNNTGYIQSLILCSVFLIFGGIGFLLSFISNQISANRIFLEKLIFKLDQFDNKSKSSHLLNDLVYVKKMKKNKI